MRLLAKAIVERVVVGSGVADRRVQRRRGRTLILCYHNVVPGKEAVAGDRSLHLGFDAFRRQMDLLQERGLPTSLEGMAGATPSDPPRFVVTFDDAYRGTISLALPELARRGIPCTVFVNPGLLGASGFWWDRVPVSGWNDPTPLHELRGEGDRVIAWARARGLPLSTPPEQQQPCSPEEFAAALTGGATAGCHTWSHPNLARLAEGEVRIELERTLEWLRSSGCPWVPWVSYPYGLTSPVVREVARGLGFAGGLRVEGGWVPAGPHDPLDLPRVNIPAGLSPEGFLLRLAGLRN